MLDEATSALDPATEAAINATLDRIAAGRTVVAVTHRLASVVNCRPHLRPRPGPAGRAGPPRRPAGVDGLYHDLWTKQQGVVVSQDGRFATVTTDYLHSVEAFAELSEEAVAALSKLFVTEHYPEGRVVIYEGDTVADKFYVVARGKVTVTKQSAGGGTQSSRCAATGTTSARSPS